MLNNAEKTLANLMAKSLIAWVDQGNWLGASWPNYVPGFALASTEECNLALDKAEELVPDLLWQAQLNFQQAADNC